MSYKSNNNDRYFSRSSPSMMDVWKEQKAKLMKKYPSLTESDLRYAEGKKGEMFERIRIKLAVTKENWKKVMEEIK